MKLVLALLFTVFFSNTALAEQEGKRGFVMDVSVSGFFSPDIKSAVVTSVEKNSNAEKAGIQVGDKLSAVFDCQIPGCPAKKAKKMISKAKGDVVFLSFIREDNTKYEVALELE